MKITVFALRTGDYIGGYCSNRSFFLDPETGPPMATNVVLVVVHMGVVVIRFSSTKTFSFSQPIVVERILKIGQYLTKLHVCVEHLGFILAHPAHT